MRTQAGGPRCPALQIKANLQSSRPLQQQGPPSPGLILQALEAVVRLNKGFKTDLATRTRPRIGARSGWARTQQRKHGRHGPAAASVA